jgi:hypothetical protein
VWQRSAYILTYFIRVSACGLITRKVVLQFGLTLVLGASGDPNVPGLGFRYDTDEKWSLPNPTGLQGVFEGILSSSF